LVSKLIIIYRDYIAVEDKAVDQITNRIQSKLIPLGNLKKLLIIE